MVASSVEIASLPDLVSYPNTEDSPAITVIWSGGTGPFNVEYTWDDDPAFGNANGNQQTVTNNSVTSPDTAAPPAGLADTSAGTTWYIRANVVDTADAGELADDHQFTYFDPVGENRYLYLLGNVGVAFHDTDEPAGGWGTSEGGTQGADGDIRDDFDRFLYLFGNVGVGFTPTDDPQAGWGTGGTEGPDGETLDFDRFLYLLANVDTTQPCPFLFRLSSQTVNQGSSLTVYGQGLVSADSPTDDWDAEVRLYETTDLGGTYQVLAKTDWTAGETEDQITVTIPSNASSGFIAVVHTTTPTCAGSNFIGVNILAVEADAQAGWWVEIWNLRNTQRIISALPDVAEASTEHVPGDIGKGHMLLPANHPDIGDILDRTTSPPVQRLVKVYQHNRFAYSFIPDDIDEDYSEDGARLVRLYGEGQERMLKWGRALFKDFPASVTRTRTRLYGSSANLLEWLNGEEDNLLSNGGFEDANTEGWDVVGSADIDAFTAVSHGGSYGGRVSIASLDEGVERTFSASAGERILATAHVTDRGATKDKTFTVEILDSEDNVVDSGTVSPAGSSWHTVDLAGIATVDGEHRLRLTQTAGTIEDFWWVDDFEAYARISGTFQLSGNTLLRLSRTNVLEGDKSLEAVFDDDTGGITIFAAVQPGQDYTFTLRFTGTAGEEIRAGMRLGGILDQSQIAATGGTDTITLSGTAGAEDQSVRIFIGGEEPTGTTIYIDNSSLTPGQPAANGGEIVLDSLEAMQSRGTLDFVQTSFTRTHDSSGLTWPETHQFEVDPRWTLWDLVDKLQGLGYRAIFAPSDWRGSGDTGWELSLFAPGNSVIDHSQTVDGPAILPGATVEKVKPSSAAPLETVVYGEGSEGVWSVAALDAATITALERREGFISNTAAQSATTVFRAATHRLETTSERGHQFTADLTDAGDPLPYFDFLPEDALRAHLPGNESRDHVPDDVYRVAAVTSKLSGSGRAVSYQVDFGNYSLYQAHIRDLILSRMLEREASENYRPGSGSVSSGGSGEGGSSAPLPGVVPRHDHLLSELVPNLEIPEDLSDLENKNLDDLDDVSVPGAGEGDMLYLNNSGLWVVVSGTKAEGKIPKIQADGSVAWDTDNDSGGGGGGSAPDWAVDLTDNADAADIIWDGTQASGMTQVTVTGSETITEKTSVLSVLFSGQGSQDYNCLLEAHTFSVGDSFAVPIRLFGDAGITVAGVIFTDGTTASDNAVAAHLQHHSNEGDTRIYTRHGTLTAMSSVSSVFDLRFRSLPWMWLRLTYQASNTFRKELSPDGISWSTVGIADVSKTMTPNHFGICWSVENQSGEGIATFGPILKVA